MTQGYISGKGLGKLRKRLQNLIQKQRPAIIEQIAKAREFGDLSENAEYHAAKEKQRFIESEIAKLQKKIITLRVINSDKINKNEVRFGAEVELFDLTKKIIITYKIVGEDETGKTKNIRQISYSSPIAKSLLGKRVDDEIKVKAPIGILTYKINKIKYK